MININAIFTSSNKAVTASPPYGGSGYEKPQSGLRPFVRFFSATFGAGVVASQRPITCPKRQLPPNVTRKFFYPKFFISPCHPWHGELFFLRVKNKEKEIRF